MSLIPPSTYEIELKYGSGRMTFNIQEVIQNTSITQYRKIISYIFKHSYQVQQPDYLSIIAEWHNYIEEFKKWRWDEASLQYQRDWKIWD
jgi:hypothetical protein